MLVSDRKWGGVFYARADIYECKNHTVYKWSNQPFIEIMKYKTNRLHGIVIGIEI